MLRMAAHAMARCVTLYGRTDGEIIREPACCTFLVAHTKETYLLHAGRRPHVRTR